MVKGSITQVTEEKTGELNEKFIQVDKKISESEVVKLEKSFEKAGEKLPEEYFFNELLTQVNKEVTSMIKDGEHILVTEDNGRLNASKKDDTYTFTAIYKYFKEQ